MKESFVNKNFTIRSKVKALHGITVLLMKIKHLFPILIVCFCIFSCTEKHEREIKNHFSKFIFKNKLREYKIESIKTDAISVGQIEIKDLTEKIHNKRLEIIEYSEIVLKAKETLDELKIGEKRYNYGTPYYSTKDLFPNKNIILITINNGLFDYSHIGREQMIEKKEIYIQSQFSKIPKIQNDIFKLEKKLDSCKKNPNNHLKWFNSTVTIKGMEASGLRRIKFFVQQYSDGEIKLLKPAT